MSQVVHDYGDICQAITELAVEMRAPISTEDFRMLNRAWTMPSPAPSPSTGAHAISPRSIEEIARGSERLGFFAHELRNMVNTAIMAFEVLKTGNVGVAGAPGPCSIAASSGLRALIGRSLAEVRLTEGVQNPEPFLGVRIHRGDSRRPPHWRPTPGAST